MRPNGTVGSLNNTWQLLARWCPTSFFGLDARGAESTGMITGHLIPVASRVPMKLHQVQVSYLPACLRTYLVA